MQLKKGAVWKCFQRGVSSGKEHISLTHSLTHRAGIPSVDAICPPPLFLYFPFAGT